jgi:Fic family protein
MVYEPRFTVTAKVLDNVTRITEILTRADLSRNGRSVPRLRRRNRLRSLHSSLAIEGNRLSLDEVSAVIDGRPVTGPETDIAEVRNAYAAYEMMDSFDPFSREDLLRAHGIMMGGLVNNAGSFRTGDEGVFDGEGNLIHLAPHPEEVSGMVDDLLEWTRASDYPMIVRSCVFHYRFEYIHPFEDGNGRLGRLWQTLLLSRSNDNFKWIPVESAIRSYQRDYYDAIEASNAECDCTVFLEFMTGAILTALEESARELSERDAGMKLTSSESSLYAMIRDGCFVDIGQAAVAMEVSVPTVNRCLRSLREKGLIRKEGNRRSGVWVTVRGGRN